jgi:hypothetical protein
MKEKTREIYEVNSDILVLFKIANEIGWDELREASIHRIFYLSSVLYTFMDYHTEKVFKNYHFSLSATGPYANIINKSIIDLLSREIISEGETGNLSLRFPLSEKIDLSENNKYDWFKIIIFILGLYGEDKVFGFVIQDPQYKDDFQRNIQKAIDISDQNKTVETLNHFKTAFEETLDDVSQIDDKEYLELYFEYVFSKIIKRD